MNIEEENFAQKWIKRVNCFLQSLKWVSPESGGDGLTSICLENRKSYFVALVTFLLINTQLVRVLYPSDTSEKPISICLEVTLA